MSEIKKYINEIENAKNPLVYINDLVKTYGLEYLYSLLAESINEGNMKVANTIYASIRLEGVHRANERKMTLEK